VDVPRELYRLCLKNHSLARAQFRVASIHNELTDAQTKLSEAQAEAQSAAGTIPPSSSLKKYVDVILLKCTADMTAEAGTYTDYQNPESSEVTWTRGKLASLHGRIIQLKLVVHRCEILLQQSIRKAVLMEEIIKQADKADHKFIDPFATPGKGWFAEYKPGLQWWWYIRIKPILFLLGGIVTTIMSLIVVYSEVVMFQTDPTLSVFALILNKEGSQANYFNLEFITLLTLTYLAICSYRVVVRLRIFNFYYMAPHQLTDEASLLFSGTILGRLTVPMCLNFLSMSHLDTHVTQGNQIHQPTAFTQIMGHVDAMSYYQAFMYHYPIAMLPVAAMTLFNVGGRIMSLCGFTSFLMEDDTTTDMVTEGKSIIRKERRMWQMEEIADRQERRIRTFKAHPQRRTVDESEDEERDFEYMLRRSLTASPEPSGGGGGGGENGSNGGTPGRKPYRPKINLPKSLSSLAGADKGNGKVLNGVSNHSKLVTGATTSSSLTDAGGRVMRFFGVRNGNEPLLDEDSESLLPSSRNSRPSSRSNAVRPSNAIRSIDGSRGPPRNIFDDM